MVRGWLIRGLAPAALLAVTAACEIGSSPSLPPQAPPTETFNPVFDCAGVEPDPRFAKRCQVYRRR